MTGADPGEVVGADPEALFLLAVELDEAVAALEEAAAVTRAALAEVAMTSTAAAELEAMAAWCQVEARDVTKRASTVHRSAAGTPLDTDSRPTPIPTSEQRRVRFLALVGLGGTDADTESWLASTLPELSARRMHGRGVIAGLEQDKTDLAVQLYQGSISRLAADAERARLNRLIHHQEEEARATAAEMSAFVADLDDLEVRELAAEVLERVRHIQLPGAPASLRDALVPLRDRVRDQLAEGARRAYMGSASASVRDVEELASLAKGLSFPTEPRHNVLVAFLRGLMAGDVAADRYASAGAELARAVGQTLSGLVAIGDVRDTAANLGRRKWGAAALSAFGIVPGAGDLAKGAEAAGDVAKAARGAEEAATRASRAADELAAALKGTPLEHWRPGQPMPNARNAAIDPRKFSEYSMNAAHEQNDGKWRTFKGLGYEVNTLEGRQAAAIHVQGQVYEHVVGLPARSPTMSPFGPRVVVHVPLTGPNGRTGTLVTTWQYDEGTDVPKLITNFLKVHT